MTHRAWAASVACAGPRFALVAALYGAALTTLWSIQPAHAQEWRGRASTRVQYVEFRPFRLDSVPIASTALVGGRSTFNGRLVTCAPAAAFCFSYASDEVVSTAPLVQDLDLTVWGFGVEGLRVYLSTRFRASLGDEEFWPRSDDHFDLIRGFVELKRSHYRFRLGRDFQVSGLGYYGYDGGSAQVRFRPARVELEAYGGWGLARGLAEPVTSDALAPLEEFQPRRRNYLFGFRASARPIPNGSIEAIYQKEIQTNRSGIASERMAFEASYRPIRELSLEGHADYDLGTGWWGKAGASVGWSPITKLFLEGRVFRYRPVFDLQTIWAAFSPTPYTGYGLSVGLRPRPDLSIRLEGERRDYADTEAEVPFQVTTDRTWRAGASASWRANRHVDVQGAYHLDFTFGSALSAGEARVNAHPIDKLTVGARFSAFQQLGEFRVDEGRVWSLGGNLKYETPLGTMWGAVDRYRHDRREEASGLPDWTQLRASFGLAFYVGSEPGRRP